MISWLVGREIVWSGCAGTSCWNDPNQTKLSTGLINQRKDLVMKSGQLSTIKPPSSQAVIRKSTNAMKVVARIWLGWGGGTVAGIDTSQPVTTSYMLMIGQPKSTELCSLLSPWNKVLYCLNNIPSFRSSSRSYHSLN